MVRDYFWGIIELNQEKCQLLKLFTPKIGKFILQILDPQKNGFQVKFQTQKHGTHTPYADMVSTPPPLGLQANHLSYFGQSGH